jgi:hypothetical protein
MFLISTSAFIVSISYGVVVVRGCWYDRCLRRGAVRTSLIVIAAVDRGIRNWQEVILLDVFFVRLECNEVVGLCSQRVVDGVRDRRYLVDRVRKCLQIMIISRRLIIDLCRHFIIRFLLLLFTLFHRFSSLKFAANTFLLRHYFFRFLILLYLSRCCRALFSMHRLLPTCARRVNWPMIEYLIGLSLGRLSFLFLPWGLERYVNFLHQVLVRSRVVFLMLAWWLLLDRGLFFLRGFLFKDIICVIFMVDIILFALKLFLRFGLVIIINVEGLLLVGGRGGWGGF